ncbi:hypothetical protein GCM10027268_18630 [Brachybacterium huguangmaarense]
MTDPTTEAAITMITVACAKQYRGTALRIDAANPGLVASDVDGGRGPLTPAQCARPRVHLATRGPDGPCGVLHGICGWTASMPRTTPRGASSPGDTSRRAAATPLRGAARRSVLAGGQVHQVAGGDE